MFNESVLLCLVSAEEELCDQKARPGAQHLFPSLKGFKNYWYDHKPQVLLACLVLWFKKNHWSRVATAKLWPRKLKTLKTTTEFWHCFCRPVQGTSPDPRFQTSKWHAQRFLRSLGEETHSCSRRQQGSLRSHLRFHINQHQPCPNVD